MNFESFNLEDIQLKYAASLKRIGNVPLFESTASEVKYHTKNSAWILETENINIHDTGKGTLMLYGDGNLSFIDKVLLEANLYEEDSIWTKIWEVIKSILSTGWETVTHTFDNISKISDGDVAGIALALGASCELLAILTVLWPPLHPLNVTLTVLAGIGLMIGGVSQCFKAGDKLGTLKHQATKVHESSDSNDPIDVFSDGTQHIMMGVAGVALSSLGVFGGKGVKQTAQNVYKGTVSVGLKKTFKAIFAAVRTQQTLQKLSSKSLAAILKHESKHFFLHYIAAVLAFFLGHNLTKKGDGGNSWLDLLKGLKETVTTKTNEVRKTVASAKAGVKKTVGGHIDMLDNIVDSLFNGIDGILILLGNILNKILGGWEVVMELVVAFSELFQKASTEDTYKTVYAAGLKEANYKKNKIETGLGPYKQIEISNDTKDFMGNDGFVKMGRSSTSVNKKYNAPGKKKVKIGKNGFPEMLETFKDFESFTKQNINENVMVSKKKETKVLLFEDYVEMKENEEIQELNENFINKGINIAKEGIQEIKAFFYGLQTSLWDKGGVWAKKDLMAVIDGVVENVSKHVDLDTINQMREAQENIIDQINSGKIKNSKQLIMTWQEAMGIYIIK